MFQLGNKNFHVKGFREKESKLIRKWKISAEKWISKEEPNENSRTKKKVSLKIMQEVKLKSQ